MLMEMSHASVTSPRLAVEAGDRRIQALALAENRLKLFTRGKSSASPALCRRKSMPTYEYQCQKCQELFSVVLSMSEHEQAKVACPACNGRKVNQQYSVFYAKTSKKS